MAPHAAAARRRGARGRARPGPDGPHGGAAPGGQRLPRARLEPPRARCRASDLHRRRGAAAVLAAPTSSINLLPLTPAHARPVRRARLRAMPPRRQPRQPGARRARGRGRPARRARQRPAAPRGARRLPAPSRCRPSTRSGAPARHRAAARRGADRSAQRGGGRGGATCARCAPARRSRTSSTARAATDRRCSALRRRARSRDGAAARAAGRRRLPPSCSISISTRRRSASQASSGQSGCFRPLTRPSQSCAASTQVRQRVVGQQRHGALEQALLARPRRGSRAAPSAAACRRRARPSRA